MKLTTRTRILFIGLSSLLLVVGVVWESWSVYLTMKTKPVVEPESGISELQNAVKLWRTKKPFTTDGLGPLATPSGERTVDSKDARFRLQIRNATGKKEIPTAVANGLAALSDVTVTDTVSVSSESITRITRKNTVPRELVDLVRDVIEREYQGVDTGNLANDAPVDMVVTLGRN